MYTHLQQYLDAIDFLGGKNVQKKLGKEHLRLPLKK
jgi:hypothetical protein